MSSNNTNAIAVLKEKIATSTRILVRERLIGPFGHPSARIPGTDLVAVLGHTHDDVKDLAETEPSDVVVMDLDGEVVEGTMDAPGERFMHTEIYRARSDVGAVIHAHPMHCIAFSMTDAPLAPIWHLCTLFADGVPVHDSAVQIDNPEAGPGGCRHSGQSQGRAVEGPRANGGGVVHRGGHRQRGEPGAVGPFADHGPGSRRGGGHRPDRAH